MLYLSKNFRTTEIEIKANELKVGGGKSEVYWEYIDDNKNVMFLRYVSSLRLLKPYFFLFILFFLKICTTIVLVGRASHSRLLLLSPLPFVMKRQFLRINFVRRIVCTSVRYTKKYFV